MGLAAETYPPIFEVQALLASAGGHVLQSRGRREIEKGWLKYYPRREAKLAEELSEDTRLLGDISLAEGPVEAAAVAVVRAPTGGVDPAQLVRLMQEAGIGSPASYAAHVENVH